MHENNNHTTNRYSQEHGSGEAGMLLALAATLAVGGLAIDIGKRMHPDSKTPAPKVKHVSSSDLHPGMKTANGNILVANSKGGYSVVSPNQDHPAQDLEKYQETGKLVGTP